MAGKKSKYPPGSFRWFVKRFASLKLAVFVLLSLGLISAVGTIYESLYDAQYAKTMVYHSFLMFFILILLTVSLISVMIDRWPWKIHHTSFLLAHIGIILVLIGGLQTYKSGVDGSLAIEIGGESRYLMMPGQELALYSSQNGSSYRTLYFESVDFLKNHPLKVKEPIEFSTPDGEFKVLDYYHYAWWNQEIRESKAKQDPPAVRLFLKSSRVEQTQWLRLKDGQKTQIQPLGPATFYLTKDKKRVKKGPFQLVFYVDQTVPDQIEYEVYDKESKISKKGFVKPGESIVTGWMDLAVRVVDYIPHSTEWYEYEKLERPKGDTTSTVKISYKGEERWVGLNQSVKFYEKDKVYVLAYTNKRHDIGFPMELLEFEVGRYPGSLKAATYSSRVQLPDGSKHVIAMNEPLKHKGLTFYQSSFQEDDSGKPVVSILSVNKDPGRFLKYAGCILVVLGCLMLFYFKRFYTWGSSSKTKKEKKA